MSTDLRTNITAALAACADGDLTATCIRLLDVLGYRSEKRFVLTPNSAQNFAATFGVDRPLHAAQARSDEWSEANVLFQLTDSEVAQIEQMHLLREDGSWNRGTYRSFLFLAIGLTGERYSRTALATITRAVNRLFMMPTPIFFRYGDKLTLAIILRRPGKRDASQDVLEKVTLIKDIDLRHPHAAHIRILEELALANLRQGQHIGSFDELQSAWAKTLDISELNKRFYQELANWYYWAVATVHFPPGDGQEDQETRHAVAVIRLITRLIFVWFIKEKGLVPAALFDRPALQTLLTWDDPQQSTYYKAILQNLFFATLNTEMERDKAGSRRFRSKPTAPNAHYGVPSVYRYQARFTDPAAALRLFADIPFLNGGLFECLDRPEQGVRIDGFSDRSDNPLCVPDELFFGAERAIDLNEIFGTRNKQYKVRGLLDIFARYKFTVEENTPIEEEVALDPELLGKVFENLLAAYNPETRTTARKQTGSFYTPREIVDYMVDEALIAALGEKLRGRGDEVEARLRQLFAYTDEPHQFTAEEVATLIDAIDALKILDPACGSGAFPMGILHKLVFILRKLDPNNARWKRQQLARAQRDRELAEQMEDEQIRERAVREADARIVEIARSFDQQDHELDYTRKLYLIENCIYGVDIQPIAVQIAKLRFFISLVADQRVDDAAPNRNVRALPNLETKFVAANSLIALPRSGQMLLRNPEIDRLEEELRRVRQRHFTARTTATKKKYREEDARLRQRIGELLQQDGWPQDMTVQLAHWNPYNQHAHAEFFDPEWMFGVTDGFDVVIGNPPYVLLQDHNRDEVLYAKFRKEYTVASYKVDLYHLFIEKGVRLLGKGGCICYITPSNFVSNNYTVALRRFMLTKVSLEQLVFFEDDVFEASVNNLVYVAIARNALSGRVRFCFGSIIDGRISITERTTIAHADLIDDKCLLVPPEGNDAAILLKRLEAGTTQLGLLASINFGMQLRDRKKYLTDVIEQPSSPKVLTRYHRPCYTGKDIQRFCVVFQERYCYFNRDAQRGGCWDEAVHNAKNKILLRQIGSHPEAALDTRGYAVLNTAFIVIPRVPNLDPRYVLAILNSRVVKFYWINKFRDNRKTFPKIKGGYLSLIPVPLSKGEEQTEIIRCVDRILELKCANPATDVTALEAEIDRLVYALYGLTEEEIKIVEGRT